MMILSIKNAGEADPGQVRDKRRRYRLNKYEFDNFVKMMYNISVNLLNARCFHVFPRL